MVTPSGKIGMLGCAGWEPFKLSRPHIVPLLTPSSILPHTPPPRNAIAVVSELMLDDHIFPSSKLIFEQFNMFMP